MALGLKLIGTFYIWVLSNQLSCKIFIFFIFFFLVTLCLVAAIQPSMEQSSKKKKKKKTKSYLLKTLNVNHFFGKRVIYNYFTFSSLNTKLNRYQVPAEFRKSFVFLYLGFKTAFKEGRNFWKRMREMKLRWKRWLMWSERRFRHLLN